MADDRYQAARAEERARQIHRENTAAGKATDADAKNVKATKEAYTAAKKAAATKKADPPKGGKGGKKK